MMVNVDIQGIYVGSKHGDYGLWMYMVYGHPSQMDTDPQRRGWCEPPKPAQKGHPEPAVQDHGGFVALPWIT